MRVDYTKFSEGNAVSDAGRYETYVVHVAHVTWTRKPGRERESRLVYDERCRETPLQREKRERKAARAALR